MMSIACDWVESRVDIQYMARTLMALKVYDSEKPQQQNETDGDPKQPQNNWHNTPLVFDVNKIGDEETLTSEPSSPVPIERIFPQAWETCASSHMMEPSAKMSH